MKAAPVDSFTRQLFESPDLLASKIIEEAYELTQAVSQDEIIHEAADLIFFTLARLARNQIPLSEIERELDIRSRKVTRRNTMSKAGLEEK